MRAQKKVILTDRSSLSFSLAIIIAVLPASSFAENPAARGTQWVRSHDFTINALYGRDDTMVVNPEMYRDANMSSSMSWWPVDSLINASVQAGLPWHLHVYPHPEGLSDSTKSESIRLVDTYPGNVGWLVWDEPPRLAMNVVAQSVQWYKNQFPDSLVYSNAFPSGGSAEQLYGYTPPAGGYTYDQYITDFVNIIQPDVLMYDVYPYNANGGTTNIFPLMNTIRQKALGAGIPYFGWIQSYQDGSHRTMSESDLRHSVFNHLAYGFKGISYFTYDNQIGPGMAEPGSVPTSVYYSAQKLNTEVANLGHTLKFLTSTEVRYVPGKHEVTYYDFYDVDHTNPITVLVNNLMPSSMTVWTAGAGGDSHLENIEIMEHGEGLDGLVGFFTDDAGQEYFMLVNEYHDADLSSTDTSLTFELTFDQTVNEILRLNRDTGMSEVITLDNHVLLLSLAGGTGDLFKYNTADFVTDIEPPVFLLGDANGDGVVSATDYASVKANFGNIGLAGGGLPGDANGDGVVSADDYAFVQANFGRVSEIGEVIPEPASILCVSMAGLVIIGRRTLHSKCIKE